MGSFAHIVITNKRFKLRRETKKKIGMKNMQGRLQRMKMKMEKMKEEQKNIGETQGQIRKTFEEIECECEELKKETKLIIQQSAITRIKLAIMFRILKAREDGDISTAGNLTNLLREIIARENGYFK